MRSRRFKAQKVCPFLIHIFFVYSNKNPLKMNHFPFAHSTVIRCISCGLIVCQSEQCVVWDAKRKEWICMACNSFYTDLSACDWLVGKLNKQFSTPAPQQKPSASKAKSRPIIKALNGPSDRKRSDDVMLELNSKFWIWNLENLNII